MPRPLLLPALAVLLVAGAPLVREPANAQWSGRIRTSGSILFGAGEQRVVGAMGSIAHKDSSLKLDAMLDVVYGDAKPADQIRRVTRRTQRAAFSADIRPFAALSPFVTLTLESSFEQRVARRHGLSVGAIHTFVRDSSTEASLSAAILDERRRPIATATATPTPAAASRVTRWSLRGRVQHQIGKRFRASHVTFYQPALQSSAHYLVRSTSESRLGLTKVLGLTTSLLVNYDSEARDRGAPVNHDGQLLFGVDAAW